MTLTRGQQVVLRTPDNPRLDGQPGSVVDLTDYGAVVKCRAAGSGYFRALASEVEPADEPARKARRAKQSGYTGDVCPACGGSRMVRNGACCVCLECGTSSGCG